MAVEKASRTYIPLEYSFTGLSIKSPTAGKYSSIFRQGFHDLGTLQPQQFTIDHHVFPAGELGIEAGPLVRAARQPRPRVTTFPSGRLKNPADDLQQRTLSASVRADERHKLAALDRKRYITQGPENPSGSFFRGETQQFHDTVGTGFR